MNQFVPYFWETRLHPTPRQQIRKNAFVLEENTMTSKMWVWIPTTILSLKCWGTGPLEITSKKMRSNGLGNFLVDRWKFPANRLYATVYKPEDGDPADFDEEAHTFWSKIFQSVGLDPNVHVVTGGKKTTFG